MSDVNPCDAPDPDLGVAPTYASQPNKRWFKPVILIVLLGIIGFVVTQYGDLLNLESLALRETQLREYQSQHPFLVYGIAFLIYVAVTGMSLPGAAALTLVFAWYFGFWPALIMISFASTMGATVAFLISRYLLGGWVQNKFGHRLGAFNAELQKEGAFYLFSLRLVPAVPFFVINLVMGLTQMKTWTFYWVSQIGMLLGTAVYVYAGSRVPDLNALADEGVGAVFSGTQLTQIAVAFVLLGLFPLVAKKLLSRFSGSETDSQTT